MQWFYFLGAVAPVSLALDLTKAELSQCPSLIQVAWRKVHHNKDDANAYDEDQVRQKASVLQHLPTAASGTVAMLQKTVVKAGVAPAIAMIWLLCGACCASCFAVSRPTSNFAGLEAFRKQEAEERGSHGQDITSRRSRIVAGLLNQFRGQPDQAPMPVAKSNPSPPPRPSIAQECEHQMSSMSDDDKEQDTDGTGDNMVISPEYYAEIVGQLQIESRAREDLERKMEDLQQQKHKEKLDLEGRIEALMQEKVEAEHVAEAGLEELRREFAVTESSYREQVRVAQEVASRQASKDMVTSPSNSQAPG